MNVNNTGSTPFPPSDPFIKKIEEHHTDSSNATASYLYETFEVVIGHPHTETQSTDLETKVFKFLQAATTGDSKFLESLLPWLGTLHPDNQLAIANAAFHLAKSHFQSESIRIIHSAYPQVEFELASHLQNFVSFKESTSLKWLSRAIPTINFMPRSTSTNHKWILGCLAGVSIALIAKHLLNQLSTAPLKQDPSLPLIQELQYNQNQCIRLGGKVSATNDFIFTCQGAFSSWNNAATPPTTEPQKTPPHYFNWNALEKTKNDCLNTGADAVFQISIKSSIINSRIAHNLQPNCDQIISNRANAEASYHLTP